jgi:AcrR family transcriptional regulator
VRAPRQSSQLKAEVAAFKRRRIIEEASDLFFARGYEATTLDAIAEQLNVTKPFIYSYCKNKSELLSDICEVGVQQSLIALDEALAAPGSASERLKLVVDRVARIVIENQRYIVVYQREEKNLDLLDARRIRDLRHLFDKKLADLLQEGRNAGEFAFEDASRTAIWISGLISWISNWYRTDGRWSATEIIMDAIRVVLKLAEAKGKA